MKNNLDDVKLWSELQKQLTEQVEPGTEIIDSVMIDNIKFFLLDNGKLYRTDEMSLLLLALPTNIIAIP